jgi:putative transposase
VARETQCTEVVAEMRSLFSKPWLEEAAREAGWLQRLRKISPTALFWTLVLGFGIGRERTLASLRRAYELETGTTLVPSAFYDRFTAPLVVFLRRAVAHGCAEMAKRAKDAEGRARVFFTDIVGIDSTVLRLHDALAGRFPGTRTNHSPAAAKLHLVMSVLGRGPRSVKITDQRTHDARVRHLGSWVRGNLLLFDLGYYSFRAFSSIRREDGFFITRLKDGANPEVQEVLDDTCTPLIQPGSQLCEVLARTRRDVLDLKAVLRFRRRTYRGASHGDSETFRIVAVRDPQSRKLHVYVTNIDADRLNAEEIAATYAGRWAIELIFKELKSAYRIDHLPSSKKHIVEALILTAVLTLIVSRRLLAAVAKRMPADMARRLRPLRWSKVFVAHARPLLALVLDPRSMGRRARARWLTSLKHEAIDPNVERYDLRDLMLAVQMS